MRFEKIRWKSAQPLAELYTHEYEKVSELYEYDFRDPAAWKARAQYIDDVRTLSANRHEVCDTLIRFNERIGNSEAAMAHINKLRQSDALVVVGGQQAGLLTGPMLVIHKAIAIVQNARAAEQKLGRPVIPVFWIAGEDHDFDEVSHTYFLNPQGAAQRLKIDHPTGRRTSVSRTKIPSEAWEDVLQQLGGALIDTEYKQAIIDRLNDIARRSETLADAFARIMAWLFGRFGLVLVDSDDIDLRQLERPMMRILIEQRKPIRDALHSAVRKLESLGFTPQAELAEDGANLFANIEGERTALFTDGREFYDRKHQHRLSEQQLLEWADYEPVMLGNNVMTRPMMQDYVFPVLGTVLGPGEIAYWAQTREAFAALGMQMPIIIPRMECTWVEGTVAKNMDKFAFGFEDIIERFELLKAAWLAEQDTLGLEQKFEEAKQSIVQLYEPLIETVHAINPGVGKISETNRQKVLEQIDFLYARAQDAFEKKHESAVRQMDRIHTSLLPLGKPQERVYNIFAYLNKYGESFIDQWMQVPEENDGLHRIAYFS